MSMDTKAPSQAVSDGQEDEEEQDGDSSPFLFPESAIEDSTEILLLPSPPSSRHSTSSHTHPLDQTPSATRQTIFLLLAILPEGILESMLIPLYPYMARGFGIGEEDVGYWSGVASSAFYMPLLVMNVVWGAASDRIGRKVGSQEESLFCSFMEECALMPSLAFHSLFFLHPFWSR